MTEIVAVANGQGVALTTHDVDAAMTAVDGLPDDGTASMQRDVMERKPSELETMSGDVVRLGSDSGVSTPVHSFIYASLAPQEQAARAAADVT
jgi:2-dehydropantoate 2-reductase